MKMYAVIIIDGTDEVDILAKAKSIGHVNNIADDMDTLLEMMEEDHRNDSGDAYNAE